VIKVTSDVPIYEVDGEETQTGPGPNLTVESHWNHRDRVVLVVDNHRYTVLAHDVEAAVKNAQNSAH